VVFKFPQLSITPNYFKNKSTFTSIPPFYLISRTMSKAEVFHYRKSFNTPSPSYTTSFASFNITRIESSSKGSSFPSFVVKTVPFTVISLDVNRDSRKLVNPFMHVSNYLTRHLATLKESWLLLLFTSAWTYFKILTNTSTEQKSQNVNVPLKPSFCYVLVIQSAFSCHYKFLIDEKLKKSESFPPGD